MSLELAFQIIIDTNWLYGIGTILLFLGSSREKKRALAKDQILGYLQGNNFESIRFERVREKLNSLYTDAFLESVINAYPTELRHARSPGGVGGIGRLVDEEES